MIRERGVCLGLQPTAGVAHCSCCDRPKLYLRLRLRMADSRTRQTVTHSDKRIPLGSASAFNHIYPAEAKSGSLEWQTSVSCTRFPESWTRGLRLATRLRKKKATLRFVLSRLTYPAARTAKWPDDLLEQSVARRKVGELNRTNHPTHYLQGETTQCSWQQLCRYAMAESVWRDARASARMHSTGKSSRCMSW